MNDLTPEEEAILRPEYEKYCENCIDFMSILSFDDWWRAAADEAKDLAKYVDR